MGQWGYQAVPCSVQALCTWLNWEIRTCTAPPARAINSAECKQDTVQSQWLCRVALSKAYCTCGILAGQASNALSCRGGCEARSLGAGLQTFLTNNISLLKYFKTTHLLGVQNWIKVKETLNLQCKSCTQSLKSHRFQTVNMANLTFNYVLCRAHVPAVRISPPS